MSTWRRHRAQRNSRVSSIAPPGGEGWTIRDHRAILHSEPYASADLGAASDVTAKSVQSEAASASSPTPISLQLTSDVIAGTRGVRLLWQAASAQGGNNDTSQADAVGRFSAGSLRPAQSVHEGCSPNNRAFSQPPTLAGMQGLGGERGAENFNSSQLLSNFCVPSTMTAYTGRYDLLFSPVRGSRTRVRRYRLRGTRRPCSTRDWRTQGCGTQGCGTQGRGNKGCGTRGCRTRGCRTRGCRTRGCWPICRRVRSLAHVHIAAAAILSPIRRESAGIADSGRIERANGRLGCSNCTYRQTPQGRD